MVYPKALALTILTEVVVVAILLVIARKPLARPLLVVVVGDLLTHPTFWFLFEHTPGSFLVRIWAWEIGVTVVEAALLIVVGRVRPAVFAAVVMVAANVASYLAGAKLL